MKEPDVAQECVHQALQDSQLRAWPLSNLKELLLEMGRQCNVRCTMCCQTDFSPGTKQAEIVWKEKLQPAYQTARILTISGGEPTVIPGASALLRMILKDYPHLELNCITNGILFRGMWIEAFVKQGGIVNVSMNAIDPRLYEKMVQFGRQKDAIAHIDQLVKQRNEAKSALKIRISTVILDENLPEMATFIQWAADHGLDQVVFSRNQLGDLRHHRPVQVQEYLREAYDAADRNPQIEVISLNDFDWIFALRKGIEPVRPRQVFEREIKPCWTAFHALMVNPNGIALPCCRTWYAFGNLVKQSLEEVWNSPAAFRFRKRMRDLDYRDCRIDCDFNYKPIPYKKAQWRKAYWVYRREPKVGVQKTLRILGLTKPQIRLSQKEHVRLEQNAETD